LWHAFWRRHPAATLCSAGILLAPDEGEGVARPRRALRPLRQAAGLFRQPVMGRPDRHGIGSTGSPEEVKKAALEVLKVAPARTLLVNNASGP
jgi:hypothetical protein